MKEAVSALGERCGSRFVGIVRRLRMRGAMIALAGAIGGCLPAPHVLMPDEQHVIDRHLVEYPDGLELRRYATGFTAPTAIAFYTDGSMLVAEGERGEEPKIWRFPFNGGHPSLFYPHEKQLIPVRIPKTYWQMYGPIGGMVVVDGNVIVTHRDENDMGVVTALDAKGGHRTICAGFPTQGDGGLTDIAYNTSNHQLYFACGSVTNSGVVGLDNISRGWVRDHPEACDVPLHDLELLGFKFQSINPMAGFFGPPDTAVTGPYQPFAKSSAIHLRGASDGKPSGAIYSVPLEGGFPKVEAWGIHDPRGIAIDPFFNPYVSVDGADMRKDCTRPIKDDPDSIVKVPPYGQTWFGWPDYSTDFRLYSDPIFQPPVWMLSKSGYPLVRPLIDLDASHLEKPKREALWAGSFPSLSGANKMVFAPTTGPYGNQFGGNLIVALSGDKSSWASGGITLPHSVGFKVVWLDLQRRKVQDFIRNVGDLPGSKIDPRNRSLIERPVDVKIGPDGTLYILDEGHMEVRNGHDHFERAAGQVFRLPPVHVPAAAPATAPAQ